VCFFDDCGSITRFNKNYMKSTVLCKSDVLLPENGTGLPVMESFYTVQGEGYHRGKAAYFIRLAGCDVGCIWCDVKGSWDMGAHPTVEVKSLVEGMANTPTKIAVITGGEPLMHDLTELTKEIRKNGIKTHIETSGTHAITGRWDWVCFSPKKYKAPTEEIYQVADELKVVIYHKSDLLWAEKHAVKVRKGCKLYLQPEWGKQKTTMPLIVDYVKANPNWEISLQIHKFMDIP